MGLFGNGQGERITELERLVSALTARVVKAEATAADCAERAYRYMKKAESRARRELDESGAVVRDPEGADGQGGSRSGSAATPSSSRRAWGARGRRLMRALRPAPVIQDNESEANGDGIHS